MRSLGKTLLDCVLLHFVHHSQTSPEFQVSLDLLICIPVPYDEKNIFFLVLVLENLIGLLRTVQLQLFLAKIWISVILNGLPWNRTEVILSFEIAPKYCILDTFVDYGGYSIYSKGFLPTVVDVMVI